MLIKELMSYIWKDKNEEYTRLYNEASSLGQDELYHRVKDKKMTHYAYPGTNMNLLTCSVCTYRLNNNFGGCAMCNYENEDIQHKVYMALLRQKNKELYTKAILNSFQNVRGEKAIPNIFELFSSYDVFNENEFPEDVFEQLFKDNNMFSKKPLGFIFEARANSITKEKLSIIKKYLSNDNRIYIEFGVEVGDEWLRNHWLNKNLTNEEIIHAIKDIHEAGFYASADVLLGIPGLTEEQSIERFIHTILWLDQIGIDQFVVLPLNRKELTLHGVIYQYLSNDEDLLKTGIVQREHTGIPWITSVIKAIDMVFDIKPKILEKFILAQVFSHQNTVDNITAYNRKGCDCNDIIRNALWNYQNKRNRSEIKEIRKYAESDRHECYKDYLDLIKLQKNAGDIPSTVSSIMNKLTKAIWSNDYENKYNQFKLELQQYGRNDQ